MFVWKVMESWIVLENDSGPGTLQHLLVLVMGQGRCLLQTIAGLCWHVLTVHI
jgi:hypothetical protein